jgi:hypothetical protein
VANGELEGTYGGHGAPLLGAVFIDDQSIVSLARGRSLHVWDVEKREKRGDFKELACELNQIARQSARSAQCGSGPSRPGAFTWRSAGNVRARRP